MIAFEPILAAAEGRAEGPEALARRLPALKSIDDLKAVSDDRYLSLMSRRIFRAGLRHGQVDAKWPAFEDVFHGFEPRRVRAMHDEELEALMAEPRIIRHWGKIKAVRDNAAALQDISESAGGFGAWLADWPGARIVDLWAELARRFKQLGGNSAPYFLRMAGKDTFLLTPDVVRGLNAWGAYDGTPRSQRERRRIQEIFNAWAESTGRPLSHLSMILALSVA